MVVSTHHIEQQNKWRCIGYSNVFSRHNISNVMCDDFALLNDVIQTYDSNYIDDICGTYKDYMSYAFRYLTKNYRNEYVIKNALLNNIISQFRTSNTIAFNEFGVGSSIADVVLFNGHSRAYEIKTEYDSPTRLEAQLADYNELFQFCYLVVHEQYYEKYRKCINPNIGVIVYSLKRGRITFEELQSATENSSINPYLLIRCLRTEEYKKIVNLYYGKLPDMNAFTAFDVCENLIKDIPSDELHKLFISTVKERKNNMKYLKEYESYLRQICLSMHIMPKEYDVLNSKLLTNITI